MYILILFYVTLILYLSNPACAQLLSHSVRKILTEPFWMSFRWRGHCWVGHVSPFRKTQNSSQSQPVQTNQFNSTQPNGTQPNHHVATTLLFT